MEKRTARQPQDRKWTSETQKKNPNHTKRVFFSFLFSTETLKKEIAGKSGNCSRAKDGWGDLLRVKKKIFLGDGWKRWWGSRIQTPINKDVKNVRTQSLMKMCWQVGSFLDG